MQQIQLIIGLGNPGKKYENHRHNVGFLLLDSFGLKFTEKFGGLLAKQNDIFYFKPQNFMNNSGVTAAQIANFYKISLQNILVVYDDLDLAFGKIKIKQAGGDGGHNGIKSLDAHLGKNYWRLRFGIDRPADKSLVHDYVLGDFTKEEKKQLPTYIKNIADNLNLLIEGKRELFLTRYFEGIQ